MAYAKVRESPTLFKYYSMILLIQKRESTNDCARCEITKREKEAILNRRTKENPETSIENDNETNECN